MTKRLLAGSALAGAIGLAACSAQVQTDINALLGSSAASTALSYVAALDPTISGYLTEADAALAANAPKVLSDTCGAVSMGNEIVATIEALDPKLIPAATQASLAASYAAITPLCPPSAPPANVAVAAEDVLGLYKSLAAAWTQAGVAPATVAAAAKAHADVKSVIFTSGINPTPVDRLVTIDTRVPVVYSASTRY